MSDDAKVATKKQGRKPTTDAARYAVHKEAVRRRRAEIASSGRDIAPIPPVRNYARRRKALDHFQTFCTTYYPDTFTLPFCEDHLRVIEKIERVVKTGGLFGVAMPRAFGKTTLCETAAQWALLGGWRRFVVLVACNQRAATDDMMDSIKSEMENNELLLADFPQVMYPIHRLDGIYQRAHGQTYKGASTHIDWTADQIVLPTIKNSPASGGIIRAVGIDGRLRGMKFKRPDGAAVRPDLVIIDDPQTDESARSPQQIANRLSVLNGAILNLAGPKQKISGIMPCTVIRQGDMADQILDPDQYPNWQGERTKLVYSFPTNLKLWEQYTTIRNEHFVAGGDGSLGTEFYRQNRKAMDAGCRIAWEEFFDPTCISAIQHALNLRYAPDPLPFWAEYQNEPQAVSNEDQSNTIDTTKINLNNLPRGHVPHAVEHLTAFVDVQKRLLYWMVCGWTPDFTGYVLDYGTFPEQTDRYFSSANAARTLMRAAPGTGLEGAIYSGLERVCALLLDREWQRDDGASLRVAKLMIDANWGQSTDTVYKFCRQGPHPTIALPAHGRYVGASTIPMMEKQYARGDRAGNNWVMPRPARRRGIRKIVYDTNFWKSFLRTRLHTAMGDRGCVTLFGKKRSVHELLLDHLTSEYSVITEGRGRSVAEWKLGPDTRENHWFDCAVGAAVAASVLGASLIGEATGSTRHLKPKMKLSEIQRNKRKTK